MQSLIRGIVVHAYFCRCTEYEMAETLLLHQVRLIAKDNVSIVYPSFIFEV